MRILACKLTVREVEDDGGGRQDHVCLERVGCCPYDLGFQDLLLLMTARSCLA